MSLSDAIEQVDVPKNRSWRPFQLALVLLNLPSLADPCHPERTGDDGLDDLLFCPTGGGKTEPYLGLTAFTLAIRRLQGVVARRSGADGVAVLMCYTLRLLTLQQFQRAAALICACELLRRDGLADDPRWARRIPDNNIDRGLLARDHAAARDITAHIAELMRDGILARVDP